jgi:hypothetical protein
MNLKTKVAAIAVTVLAAGGMLAAPALAATSTHSADKSTTNVRSTDHSRHDGASPDRSKDANSQDRSKDHQGHDAHSRDTRSDASVG